MKIARNIKELRQVLGLTQEMMAELLGITQSRISHYEKGCHIPCWMEKRIYDFAKKKRVRFKLEVGTKINAHSNDVILT